MTRFIKHPFTINQKAKSKHKSNFQSLQHLKENLTSTAVPWQSNEETKNEERKRHVSMDSMLIMGPILHPWFHHFK